MNKCFILLAMALTVSSLSAAEAPPSEPLMEKAPNPGKWTVEVKQKLPPPQISNDPKQAAIDRLKAKTNPRMVRMMVEQAGNDWHREVIWEDGKKDTYWLYHGIVVIFQPRYFHDDQVIVTRSDSISAPPKPDTVDFPDAGWIDAKYFTGTVTYTGKKCHCYAQPADSGKGKIVAWVDAKTRLPVAVEDDFTLKTYEFQTPDDPLLPQGIFAKHYLKLLNAPGTPAANQP